MAASIDSWSIEPVGPGEIDVTLRVNGIEHALRIDPRATLLDALRACT
jgi:hypothetical protein